MSRNCNKCGAPLRDGAKFCKKCGQPVVDEVTNEKEANQIPNHTQEAPVIVEKGKKGSGGCFPTILKAVIGIVILFFAAAALFGKSDDKSTKVEKTPDTAESALASFEITGKISSSTFSKGSDGFMANVDNKVYVVDLKNNQAARVENFSYILNDLRNQQNAGNSTGRIIPQFLIFNDKHGKDDDKGEWRNNNHFLPVFVPIKVDGAGNIKSEGRMSSGKGAAPSHYQGFLEEQKNVDLVNLFLKDISSFMDSSDTAIVPNPSPVYIGVINANEVNVRTGPGKEFKSLGVFFKGDKVRLVGERGNNIGEFWYQIEYDNPSAGLIKGWVRKDFINIGKAGNTTSTNLPIKVKGVSGTSYLVMNELNKAYPATQIADGVITTCWSEGVRGYGVNERVTFELDDVYELKGFNIWTGYQKSEDLFYKNGRPIALMVRSEDGYSNLHKFNDSMGMQQIAFTRPIKTKFISFTIKEVASGKTSEDACISEISFF